MCGSGVGSVNAVASSIEMTTLSVFAASGIHTRGRVDRAGELLNREGLVSYADGRPRGQNNTLLRRQALGGNPGHAHHRAVGAREVGHQQAFGPGLNLQVRLRHGLRGVIHDDEVIPRIARGCHGHAPDEAATHHLCPFARAEDEHVGADSVCRFRSDRFRNRRFGEDVLGSYNARGNYVRNHGLLHNFPGAQYMRRLGFRQRRFGYDWFRRLR